MRMPTYAKAIDSPHVGTVRVCPANDGVTVLVGLRPCCRGKSALSPAVHRGARGTANNLQLPL